MEGVVNLHRPFNLELRGFLGEVAGKLAEQTTTAMPDLWLCIRHNSVWVGLIATIAFIRFQRHSDRTGAAAALPAWGYFCMTRPPIKTFRLMEGSTFAKPVMQNSIITTGSTMYRLNCAEGEDMVTATSEYGDQSLHFPGR